MSYLRALAMFSGVALITVWLVYPAVIAARAAAIHRKRRAADARPASVPRGRAASVSIIIATRDEANVVRERIEDCRRAAANLPSVEIVVAIDARVGRAAIDEGPAPSGVRVVRGDAPGGKAAALNAAVGVATGEILVFTDVHQRFEPMAIERLVAALEDERFGAASGRLELAPGARRSLVGRYWSYERWLRRCEAEVHSCVGATGAIWAMRRSLWAPLPANLILDDVYTPMRVVLAKRRVAFVDEARAVDVRVIERAQEYARKVRTLTGILQLCAWMPVMLLPNRNPIWAQFVIHKLLRLLTPYWGLTIVLWAVFAAGGAIVGHSSRILAFVGASVGLLAASRWIGSSAPPVANRLRAAVMSGLLLQWAVVVATVNGIKRRWDVWHV